jgi:hypothetical protein
MRHVDDLEVSFSALVTHMFDGLCFLLSHSATKYIVVDVRSRFFQWCTDNNMQCIDQVPSYYCFRERNVVEWGLGRDCACESWCSSILQTHPCICMCNIYEEREFGRVYINGLHCWFCVHFELEHPVFHEYNRGSPRNSILFVADDHSSCWLVERQERAGTRSVVFVKRMTLVMLKNMLGGSLVNEFVSPVSGSECGPENRPPFGHPLWVPKRRLIIWAVFWTTVRWPFWNRCGYQNLMSASTQLDVHLRSAVLVCSWRASPTSEIHSGWINW